MPHLSIERLPALKLGDVDRVLQKRAPGVNVKRNRYVKQYRLVKRSSCGGYNYTKTKKMTNVAVVHSGVACEKCVTNTMF